MKVIITDNLETAKEIANFLGAYILNNGYYEGNGYFITWTNGHLVRLEDLEIYQGFESKNEEETLQKLPFIPDNWKLRIATDEQKKQYFIVKSCFDNASEIISATEASPEGELIFRYMYLLSGCKISFSRLLISSYTFQAMKIGFANLRPSHEFDNLFKAAQARNRAEWLIKENLTRLYACESMALETDSLIAPFEEQLWAISEGKGSVQSFISSVAVLLVERFVGLRLIHLLQNNTLIKVSGHQN